MSIEELKMIFDAVASLGASGKEAFIWWLVVSYGARIFFGLMLLCASLSIPYLICRALLRMNDNARALAEIGRTYGVDYWYWCLCPPSSHSLNDLMDAFRKAQK